MKARIIKIIQKYQHTKLSNCFFTSKFKLSGMSHKSVNSLQLHRAMPCELIIQRKKKSLFNYSATFQRNRGTLTSISISCCAIKLRLLCNWRRLLTWGRMHRATSYRWARAGNKKKEFSAGGSRSLTFVRQAAPGFAQRQASIDESTSEGVFRVLIITQITTFLFRLFFLSECGHVQQINFFLLERHWPLHWYSPPCA